MISVVVLTYNRRRYLERCLRSLLRQDWTQEDYEIIVADDGSSDATAKFVNEWASSHPNLHYVRQPHKGIAAVRNLGLSAARGEIVAFLADDYELAPDYVRTVSLLMDQNTTAMVVRFKVVAGGSDFSNRISDFYYSVGTVKRLIPPMPETQGSRGGGWSRFKAIMQYAEQPGMKHGIEAAGGAAFRRKVFEIVGLFDENLQRSEDTDMAARLRRHHIQIYYYPLHEIRHHYERFPDEALRKNFLTGVNRYFYHRKHRSSDSPAFLGLVPLGVDKVLTLAATCVYCHRHGRLLELLLYSPFLFLLEATNKLGYLTAMLRGRP